MNHIHVYECENSFLTGIRLKFKTGQRNGLLLFAASAGRQEEFLVLQFKMGRPSFIFDPQGGCYIKMYLLYNFIVLYMYLKG